ncbi:hypothetical protein ABE30_28855 [Bacillus tropicus]|nr:hypothetical protein [Bacillus tropicus]MBG9880768.1 hypothetical protein [Bacillus tropicus]MBG9923715.1 hypothetical protein [Bacillus tropicus]MBJ8356243.1 hypothetical protein [Bacillus mycoides]
MNQTNSQNIASFMAGDVTEDDYNFLNNIMSNMINETNHKPSIFIHLGAGEPHYEVHVKPLMKLLEKRDINYTLDLGDYSKHSDVGVFYPPILKEKISDTFDYPIVKSLEPKTDEHILNGIQTFTVETDSKDNKIAWYLYHDKERIGVQNYSTENTFTVTYERPGTYEITAFVINNKKRKVSMQTTPIIITADSK